MQVCAKYKVPIVITSLGARTDVSELGVLLAPELQDKLPADRFDLKLPAGVEVRTLDLEQGASH